MMLHELLENTLNPISHIRQNSELIIQNSVTSDEFIIQLADYSFLTENPLHLRQLSLILIIQQTKRRLKSFSETEREYFLKLSFFILNSSDHSLKNCGTSLLSSLFVNGTSTEQNRIASQLLSALNDNELNPIHLSLRCLSEIVEETNLTTQVKMLSALSDRLHQLTHSLSWKDSTELICYIAKIFRKIATRASECKLADVIPSHETEVLMNSFGPFIEILLLKLPEHYQTTIDIFSNLSLLLEIMRFICIAFEGFPYLYEENEAILSSITGLCWKYLISLIEMKHLSSEELKSYETTSEEGDRVSIDIFVILVFELLQICLNSVQDSGNQSMIGSAELVNLIRVLMRYIQLSSEQYEQAVFCGNEFIAAEEDDTLELSLRHTGKIFLKSLSNTCFKDLMESVFQILETDLDELNQLFDSTDGDITFINLPSEWILKLEAMMFTLSAIGRSIVKKYMKSSKTDMSVASSPAPFLKQRHDRRHKNATVESITENDAVRLCQIISILVSRFYQFPPNIHELSAQEISCFTSLSIVRGAISKLLTIYSPILVKFVSLQPVISTCLNLSLLPSLGPDDPQLEMKLSESLSSRLLHCRGFGEMLRIASRSYGPTIIAQNMDGNIIQAALESCAQLCALCNESTIHLPLEIITIVVSIVTQSYEVEYENLSPDDIMTHPNNYLSEEIISNLVKIGLTVWSLYCFDPFALEISKDMLFSTLRACMFNADSLTIFLNQFIPSVDHMIGELVANQSSKNLSDLSVKLLADSVSKCSICSPYSSEAARRISLPTIQAIIRIMHFSTDVDGIIDVGDVLRSLVILLSAREFSIPSIPSDIIEELVTETLICIRIIFSKLMEYNYSTAIGALYQLIAHFPTHSERGGYQEFIQQSVNIILSLGKSNNHRNILTMGLIHIFNNNPLLIAESLGHIKLNTSNETALQYLLEVWFDLHPLLESPYSLIVSTNGLIELIRMYSLQGISSGFLIRVLRLLLETLPSVIRNENQTTQTVSFTPPPPSYILEQEEDQEAFDDDASSEGDYFFSDEEENGDEEGGLDFPDNEGFGDEDSPFAPAELYLSDLIDINNSKGCNSTHVYIPDDLVYCPFKQDPLSQSKISMKLAALIATAEQQPTGIPFIDDSMLTMYVSGILLASLNSLDSNEQQLLRSLLSESS